MILSQGNPQIIDLTKNEDFVVEFSSFEKKGTETILVSF